MTRTIVEALNFAERQLSPLSDVARLEAEVLLAHVLNVTRVHLHTWPEKILTESQEHAFLDLVASRTQGQPIAYLLGQREFWSLEMVVTPSVLIPRPETELLVECALEQVTAKQAVIADMGTGSGAIAIALAHERREWMLHASDLSAAALEVAQRNAARLNIPNVNFHLGSWCDALPKIKFDAIVSNPPYIAEDDIHLAQGDVRFEPRSALVSAENGLCDIILIIDQAKSYLKSGGFLFLEHGYQQAKKVASIFKKAGYTHVQVKRDLMGIERVTFASWRGFDIDYSS